MKGRLEYAIRQSAQTIGGDYRALNAYGALAAIILAIRTIYLAFNHGVIISFANTSAVLLQFITVLFVPIFGIGVGVFAYNLIVGDKSDEDGLPESHRWSAALSIAIGIVITVVVWIAFDVLIERIPLVGKEYHLLQTDDDDDN